MNPFKIIKKDAWIVSKDAFFTTNMHVFHQRIFKFEWFNQSKFSGVLNGYLDAMATFAKMLKPVFGYLRHLPVVFVDDSY